MAFLYRDLESAIETRFQANWSATPSTSIAWKNTGFDSDAAAGAAFVEFRIDMQGSAPLTVSLYQRASGILWVGPHVPEGVGEGRMMDLIDAARAIFEGAGPILIGTGPAHLTFYSATSPIEDFKSGWYVRRIGFVFKAY